MTGTGGDGIARAPRWAALVAVAGALAGCGGGAPAPPPRPTELATVDVAAAPDAGATTATDVVAAPRPAGAVAGELPEGFPREVPLPAGGGLVDFGPAPGGAWVELVVAAPRAQVERAHRQRLVAAGFEVGADGALRRGALRLGVRYEPRGAGTAVRIETLAR